MNRAKRTRARILAAPVTLAALFTLTGCGDPSIAERVANRDECEQAGGTYKEWTDTVFEWTCNLSTKP